MRVEGGAPALFLAHGLAELADEPQRAGVLAHGVDGAQPRVDGDVAGERLVGVDGDEALQRGAKHDLRGVIEQADEQVLVLGERVAVADERGGGGDERAEALGLGVAQALDGLAPRGAGAVIDLGLVGL